MIHTEAFRQIVDRVNAKRPEGVQYRNMGTLAKWSVTHDRYVCLDSLALRMQLGAGGTREKVCTNGVPAEREDVERATREIVDYLAHAQSEAHH